MNSTGKKFLKNASALMSSQLITWILTLLLMVFVPRYLGATAVGQYHLAMSIWAIMGVFMAFGMDLFLTKEIAREPRKITDLFGTTILIRLILFVISFLVVGMYVYVVGYSPETAYVIYLMGFVQLIWMFVAALGSIFQGLEIMGYMSLASIVGKAVNTVFGITILLLGYGVYVFVIVTLIGALINVIMLFLFLRHRLHVKLHARFSQIIPMLKASSDYLMVDLALIFYQQVDVVIISLLVNEQTIGWYGASDRLFGTLLFFPTIFIIVIFPVLTRQHEHDPSALPNLMRKSVDLMLLMSIPIGLGISIIAVPLSILLFGEDFAPSGAVLTVLGIVLIFTYFNILLGRFLVAVDRQRAWTLVMVAATILTVPLDLVFIPWCHRVLANGAIGGAMSYGVTEFAMVIAGLVLLPRGSLGWSNARTFILVLIAGLGMVGATWWFRDMFIAIPIVIGAVTYTALIALLRVIPKEDIMVITGLLQQVRKRLRPGETEPASIGGA